MKTNQKPTLRNEESLAKEPTGYTESPAPFLVTVASSSEARESLCKTAGLDVGHEQFFDF